MRKIIFTFFIICSITTQSIFAQRYWNSAAEFNGSNHISVSPAPGINNLSGSFAFECWFNAGNINSIASLISKSSIRILLEPHSTNFVRVRIQNNGTTHLYSSYLNPIPKNKWTHLAVVYDSTVSGSMRIYRDGIQDTSRTGNNLGPRFGNDSLTIGDGFLGAYKGMIDDVRLWERPISGGEILDNMRNPYVQPLNSYTSGNFQTGIILSTTFEFANSGPANSSYVYMYDGSNEFFNRGQVGVVDLGKNPSTTLGVNHSLQLTGNSGYGRVEPDDNINFNGPVTVEAWVYPKTFGSIRYILRKGNDYQILLNPTGLISFVFNGTGISTLPIPLNQWTHIAIKCDASGAGTLYLNGAQNASYNFGARPSPGTDTLYIGSSSSSANFFDGFIDAVRISNFVKTEAEIKRDMFCMVDYTNRPNAPNSTASFDFEFQKYSSTGLGGFCDIRGSAKYSSPVTVDDTPISPILGSSNLNFPAGFLLRTSVKKVPETGTAGYTYDTLNVSSSSTINDLKLLINMNHTSLYDLQIKLYSPQGDSIIVFDRNSGIEYGTDNLITVFTDDADRAMENGIYVSFSPRVKPLNPLNARFAGRNPQGKWRLLITDFTNGSSGALYSWGLRINNSVHIKTISTEVPMKFNLSQNYPNPFNPVTKINFSLNKTGIVSLKVFDITGKEVAELINKNLMAGSYEAEFNGTELSSGVYFYTLSTESFTETKKMILMK